MTPWISAIRVALSPAATVYSMPSVLVEREAAGDAAAVTAACEGAVELVEPAEPAEAAEPLEAAAADPPELPPELSPESLSSTPTGIAAGSIVGLSAAI